MTAEFTAKFTHDYYFPPPKDADKQIPTVLCMRCGLKIRSHEMSPDEMKSLYREKRIMWVSPNGMKGKGVIVLCPSCHEMNIKSDEFPLIHLQILNALEKEAKWADVRPCKTVERLKPENLEV